MTDLLKNGLGVDGVDRRGFLRCMAWAGAGVVWTVAYGVPSSKMLGQTGDNEGFQFVQISDSHIGFSKPANADVNAKLQIAIDKINALPQVPDFLIHTGDLTHLAKPAPRNVPRGDRSYTIRLLCCPCRSAPGIPCHRRSRCRVRRERNVFVSPWRTAEVGRACRTFRPSGFRRP